MENSHFLIIREEKGVSFDIYRKPSHVKNSNHSHSHKMTSFQTMIYRLFTVSLSAERFRKVREKNGYQPSIIQKYMWKKTNRDEIRGSLVSNLEEKKKRGDTLSEHINVTCNMSRLWEVIHRTNEKKRKRSGKKRRAQRWNPWHPVFCNGMIIASFHLSEKDL